MLLEAKDIRVSFRKENQTRLFGSEPFCRRPILPGQSRSCRSAIQLL